MFDRIGHPFHIVDPRQRGWQADAVALSEDRQRRGYRIADAAFDAISSRLVHSVRTRPTALVTTSEYGFFPAHTRITINRLLADGGFAVATDDSAEVRAFASSTSAHIRVNPALVPASALAETVERLGAPRFVGKHGYAPQASAAQGFFLITGLEIESVDVAVTLADLLGIEPPRGSEGRIVVNELD